MQLNKSIKIFINYFFGPLLFAWLAYSIYRQIMHQPQLEASWQHMKQSFDSYKILYLAVALLLIFVNWGIEAWKWKISLDPVFRLPYLKAFEAVLSGVSFSVTMPNRVGEYFGRMMYLPEGNRLRTISITLVGSFAQLLTTILLGTIGFIILKEPLLQAYPGLHIMYQFAVYGLVAVLFLLLLVYFNIAGSVGLFKNWIKSERYLYLIEALRNFDNALLLRVFLLSGLRYMVFLLQYILIFYLFEVNVSVATIACIMSVVFLAMAIIPSIALVEVGLRGEISIRLMALFTTNSLGVGLTSVTVWFMNLIIPAVIGSLLILNVRVFKKKNGLVNVEQGTLNNE